MALTAERCLGVPSQGAMCRRLVGVLMEKCVNDGMTKAAQWAPWSPGEMPRRDI
jgi:hypothetical protein